MRSWEQSGCRSVRAARRLRAALLALSVALLAPALTSAPAAAATAAPTLIAPTSSSNTGSPMQITYELPEGAAPNSAKLIFSSGVTDAEVTLASAEATAGEHSFQLNFRDLEANSSVASATASSLSDGTYSITLVYQNILGEPPASAEATSVTLKEPLCKAGHYSESGIAPCAEATAGHYVEGEGQTSQTPCEAGTHDPSSGSTKAGECVADTPGHASGEGAAEQSECAKGTFATTSRSSVCTPAEPGHYVPTTGAAAQQECTAGTYADETGEAECSQAPRGYYVESPGSYMADACPIGTYDPSMGSTSKTECVADTPGHYSSLGAAEQSECAAGTFAEKAESSICIDASAGAYVPSSGASAEQECPPGTYSDTLRATSCTPTPPDTYATGGAIAPTPCPAGTEAPEGASHCTAIPAAPTTQSSTDTTSTSAGAGAGASATFALSAPRRQASLRRTGGQSYELRCSVAETVLARVSVTVRAVRRDAVLKASARLIACPAGSTVAERAALKLTRAARRLLSRRGAKVSVTIVLVPAGGGASTLASATILGAR